MPVDCGSQVVICDLPIRLDTYRGCAHDCKYCFARRKRRIDEVEPDNCISQLQRFIRGERTINTNWCDWDIPIHWGGMSDPFQPIEKRYRISRNALEVFAAEKYPFIVSTKGRLICEQDYLDLIKQCNAVVQISMACDKYDKIEKGAPPYAERLDMCKIMSANCKRLIVRIQPYFTDCLHDVLRNMEQLKECGVFGVSVEGMKFFKPQKGLVKVGGDWVYRKEVLKRHFEKIKTECHNVGLKFYCAENRLRTMGDSMTCCGCEGVEGFCVNKYNLEHLYNTGAAATEKMHKPGTAKVFNSVYQRAGVSAYLAGKSFAEIMSGRALFDSYEPVVLGGLERTNDIDEKLQFTNWLKATGITRKEVDYFTQSRMSSHFLCTQREGQVEVPTPEMFERLLQCPKIKEVPENIKVIIYGKRGYHKRKYEELFGAG